MCGSARSGPAAEYARLSQASTVRRPIWRYPVRSRVSDRRAPVVLQSDHHNLVADADPRRSAPAPASTPSAGGSRAIPASTASSARPGNAGIAALVRHRAGAISTDPDAVLALAERERHRSHRRRARGAAGRGRRRSLSRRAGGRCSARRGRRAARDQQGVRQGLHGAPRRADRAVSGLPIARTRRSPRSAAGSSGSPVVVKADGLAAGKGVVVAAEPRGGGGRRPRDDGATARSATPARASCSKSA